MYESVRLRESIFHTIGQSSADLESQGKASEKNMYADIEATYKSIKQRYNIPDSKIILYGQSIGKNILTFSSVLHLFFSIRYCSNDRLSITS